MSAHAILELLRNCLRSRRRQVRDETECTRSEMLVVLYASFGVVVLIISTDTTAQSTILLIQRCCTVVSLY